MAAVAAVRAAARDVGFAPKRAGTVAAGARGHMDSGAVSEHRSRSIAMPAASAGIGSGRGTAYQK
jgi:hypothetical protein